MGNSIPWILPERQFVRYVPETEVKALYKIQGVTPIQTTYHQMPSHKAFEKYCKQTSGEAVDELYAWEMKYQELIRTIPLVDRERLFPAVAVWGEKV